MIVNRPFTRIIERDCDQIFDWEPYEQMDPIQLEVFEIFGTIHMKEND